MAIPRGIAELFEAIPERIEVSGQAPTWRVTGGSFEAAVDYANEAFDEPVVLARRDRRWWRRVTLTVTTDPALAAEAPPLAALSDPAEPAPDTFVPRHAAERPVFASFLGDAFERQAERTARVPDQRRRRAR